MTKKRVGCLFGSFNPPHMGHLIIGQYMATRMDFDEVQLIVSPQNPLKQASELAPAEHRLKMARIATSRNPLLKVNPIEFKMAVPSYTIDTLDALRVRHPGSSFQLIIGSDNLVVFKKWKDWRRILEDYGCVVYQRPGHKSKSLANHPRVTICEAPFLDISATYIRARIRSGESVRYLTPPAIDAYIRRHGLYR